MGDFETTTVRHLARLCALSLSDAEVSTLSRDLEDIVRHVRSLQEVATPDDSVPHALSETLLREDIVRAGLSQDDALKSAPEARDGGFVVPTFVDAKHAS